MTDVLVPCLPDQNRQATLTQGNLLESLSEPAFDRLTRLAARLMSTPIALITFADDHQLFLKSCMGLGGPLAIDRELPLSDSVCQFVVSSARPLVLRDARDHPVLHDFPAVRNLGVVAYAGLPLTLSNGTTIGTFCVIDQQPRDWTEHELDILQELATSAITEIELRLDIAERKRVEASLRAQEQEVRELNESLERRVVERTAQIEEARRELVRQIAVCEQAEAALRASEERCHRVFEAIGCGVVLLDARGAVLDANDAAEKILGVSPAHLRAHGCPLLIDPGQGGAAAGGESPIARATRACAPVRHLALQHRRPDGKNLWLLTDVIPLSQPGGPVAETLVSLVDITEQVEAQHAHMASEEAKIQILDTARDAFVATDGTGQITEWNRQAERIFGWSRESALGQPLSRYFAPPWLRSAEPTAEMVPPDPHSNSSLEEPLEFVAVHRDGHTFPAEATVWSTGTGSALGINAFIRDLTQRKAAEESLRQSEAHFRQTQKMEAMGRLAGGVAHDFNNLLTVIIGMTGLAMRSKELTPTLREQLQDIEQAADRAAALTQQLLAFSRKQVLTSEVLELNELVGATANMLRRLIGEDIELVTTASESPAYVRVDRNQFEQVLLNLAVNAQDAMPQGGQLAIALDEVEVATDALESGEIPRGPYIQLTVRDTGVGMDNGTCARVFEPFFTTKPLGHGTGLGLSTVYGIVRQSGGYADVRSEVGRGTTFLLYFPRSADCPSRPASQQRRGGVPGGTETIVLVEDEPQVRALTHRILEGCGYTVHAAGRGEEALALVDGLAEPPALLITDMVMPGLNGRELAERLTARFPTLRVLLMSGYTDDALVRLGTIDMEYRFLNKPFTPITLATKVRQILDLPQPPSTAR